jgi:hypothetical protein
MSNLLELIEALVGINRPEGFFVMGGYNSETFDITKINEDFARITREKFNYKVVGNRQECYIGLLERNIEIESLVWIIIVLHKLLHFERFGIDVDVNIDVLKELVSEFHTDAPNNEEGITVILSRPLERDEFEQAIAQIAEKIPEFKDRDFELANPEIDDDGENIFPIEDYIEIRGKDLDLYEMDDEITELASILPIHSIQIYLLAYGDE